MWKLNNLNKNRKIKMSIKKNRDLMVKQIKRLRGQLITESTDQSDLWISEEELVKNPNPKGRKDMVTQQYADQWRDDTGGGDDDSGRPEEEEPETEDDPWADANTGYGDDYVGSKYGSSVSKGEYEKEKAKKAKERGAEDAETEDEPKYDFEKKRGTSGTSDAPSRDSEEDEPEDEPEDTKDDTSDTEWSKDDEKKATADFYAFQDSPEYRDYPMDYASFVKMEKNRKSQKKSENISTMQNNRNRMVEQVKRLRRK